MPLGNQEINRFTHADKLIAGVSNLKSKFLERFLLALFFAQRLRGLLPIGDLIQSFVHEPVWGKPQIAEKGK